MHSKLAIPLFALVLFGAACGSEDTDTPADGSISVAAFDFGFDPSTISLEPGVAVTLSFDNTGDAPHTFTSDDLGVDIRTSAGGEGTQTFTAPTDGTFAFRCTIHPDRMTGEFIVGSGAGGGSSGGDKSDDTKEGPAENDDGYDY